MLIAVYLEYSHTWLGFYPESEPPAALISPLNKARPSLERSPGKLSDTSEPSEKADVKAAKVNPPGESDGMPTVTEDEQVHAAHETVTAQERANAPDAQTTPKDGATVEAGASAKVESGVDSAELSPSDATSEFKSNVKADSETASKVNPTRTPNGSTRALPRGKSAMSQDGVVPGTKAGKVPNSFSDAIPGAKGSSRSDSDSDSDIIVTSSETPLTIGQLTASMALNRTPSAERSISRSPSAKSVRFSDHERVRFSDEIAAQEKEKVQLEDDDSSMKYPNPYAEGFSRTDFLRKQLYSRRDKWTTTKSVSIRIVTYNVNDRVPPPGTKELGPLVGYGQDDIVVVGLQEADLRGSSMLVAQGGGRAAAWEEAIMAGFGDRRDLYEKVDAVQYVGVVLFVFARSDIRTEIRMCETSARGIGILGVGGNKAGVAARMKIFDTTVCFVCSRRCPRAGCQTDIRPRRLRQPAGAPAL